MVRKLVLESPARIHFGLVNPFNRNYRLYVSAGVTIEEPKTVVVVDVDKPLHIEGCREEEVEKRLKPVIEEFGLTRGYVRIESCIPKHVGLGSTTQLLLTTVHALLIANNILGVNLVNIAEKLQIGKVSGVGTYAYMYGGFVVDSGKTSEREFPKLLLRLPFPEEWRFVVVIPRGRGLDEKKEAEIFERGADTPVELVWQASFTLFHELVPSLLDGDFDRFAKALGRLQEVVGSMFSKYQGGVYASYSQTAVEALRRAGALGVGQSSWGPTVYAVTRSHEEALGVYAKVKEYLREAEVFIAKPRNTGVRIRVVV
ncbi:MAG: GHMP kinase [Desulfurococcaceae archaeon]